MLKNAIVTSLLLVGIAGFHFHASALQQTSPHRQRTELSVAPDFSPILAPGGLENNIGQSLEELVAGGQTTELAGIAIAISVDGKTIYQGAAGCATIRNRKTKTCRRPLKADTKVRVASISKMVVALGLFSMVEDGLIDLDRDISEHLGWSLRNPNFPETPITARQLLSHTSSLRDPATYWVEAPDNIQSLFGDGSAAFAKMSDNADHKPGVYFSYANLNYGILATVMEKVSEERFDQIMQARVFAPRNLNVGFNWAGVSKSARKNGATLYRKENDKWAAQIDDQSILKATAPFIRTHTSLNQPAYLEAYQPGDNGTLFSPQGGLRANVLDLLQLTTAMHNNSNMQAPAWQLNEAGSNGDSLDGLFQQFGLGTQIIDMADGDIFDQYSLTGHGGEAFGLYSGAWHVNAHYKSPIDDNFKTFPPYQIAYVITGTAEPLKQGSQPELFDVEMQLLQYAHKLVFHHHAAQRQSQPVSTHKKTHSAHGHHDEDEPRPYDKTRNAMADVNAAIEKATVSGKKPLLVLGANWCHDSRGLAARFDQPEFVSLIGDHYELVYVDVGRRDRNLHVAQRFGINELFGTPTVLVLSPDRTLLNRDTAHLWKRADSVSDQVTYDYFKTFAEGGTWTRDLD